MLLFAAVAYILLLFYYLCCSCPTIVSHSKVIINFFLATKCCLFGLCCSCITLSSSMRFLLTCTLPLSLNLILICGPLCLCCTCSSMWNLNPHTRNLYYSLTKVWGKYMLLLVSSTNSNSFHRWKYLSLKHEHVNPNMQRIYFVNVNDKLFFLLRKWKVVI